MALELRPNCAFCDCDLPPESRDARICTYECTLCAACVDTELFDVCSNCGGGFTPRPIRPAGEWRPGLSRTKRPPSSRRRSLDYTIGEIRALSQRLRDVPSDQR